MAELHSIPPFPDDIDRDWFAAFLSGLVAGEGYFILYHGKKRIKRRYPKLPEAIFGITLRADDRPLLELVRSFLRAGHIARSFPKSPNKKPCAQYHVRAISELHTIIVPHFETHPLLAKKAKDFAIWKQGVALMYEVTGRRLANRGPFASAPWTPEEKEHFAALSQLLKEQRVFQAPSLVVPAAPPAPPGLFDSLPS